jgi:hypothetical protein
VAAAAADCGGWLLGRGGGGRMCLGSLFSSCCGFGIVVAEDRSWRGDALIPCQLMWQETVLESTPVYLLI